jgi:hypothetical protein
VNQLKQEKNWGPDFEGWKLESWNFGSSSLLGQLDVPHTQNLKFVILSVPRQRKVKTWVLLSKFHRRTNLMVILGTFGVQEQNKILRISICLFSNFQGFWRYFFLWIYGYGYTVPNPTFDCCWLFYRLFTAWGTMRVHAKNQYFGHFAQILN